MQIVSKAILAVSGLLFITLLVLRIVWPECVIQQRIGYALCISWAFMLFLGFALLKNIKLGTGSAGIVLVYISTCILASITNFLMGLGFFESAPSNQKIKFLLMAATPITLFTWWKLSKRNDPKKL